MIYDFCLFFLYMVYHLTSSRKNLNNKLRCVFTLILNILLLIPLSVIQMTLKNSFTTWSRGYICALAISFCILDHKCPVKRKAFSVFFTLWSCFSPYFSNLLKEHFNQEISLFSSKKLHSLTSASDQLNYMFHLSDINLWKLPFVDR